MLEILGRADDESRPVLRAVALDGRFMRGAAINGDRLGDPAMPAYRFDQELFGGWLVPIVRAGAAELHQEGALGSEFLDAMIPPIGHGHLAELVHD